MNPVPVRGRGILEVAGLGLGHAGRPDPDSLSGVTALLPASGSTVGVDVRGGGPATHETDVIAPGTHSYGADAIVLTGGSALGLRSVAGVSEVLAEAGRGFPAPGLPGTVIPLVPAAAIYDLGRGDGTPRPPTTADGAAAARAALATDAAAPVRGSIGAGLGARSGLQSLRSSLGSFALRLPGGCTVAALVAANPLGSIGTPDGTLWAHGLLRSFGLDLPAPDALPDPERLTAPPGAAGEPGAASARNTTIAIVATEAALDPAQVTRMAASAHAGIARAVRPSHTLFDGDTVFALATGARPLSAGGAATGELVAISAAAADALSLAIIDAHVSAAPLPWAGPPCLADLAPDFVAAFAALD
ncbi:L-aminopeptidase/D-esterase-like protein [Brevibacterium sanguinis]|uniref:L-aminopeptidase/D-esterase-like protein n=2 Tax=Brevibacterium TaxID=1696 RepID=A0A366IKL5_9MICO|nr:MULTISPECIES: P1 family peptidase [Brevibacterium]RBP66301.1 L-aminopeptidase/D-esterase-like protein [Brevibacterium sanguinis]RBP72952.1 L-aminopeptidase/D-esterase-like protein [Brevibacterium celere]